MDSTSSASYWIAGVIVVLAIVLGAWLIASNNNGSVGIPNTGAQTTDTGTGTTGTTGTGSTDTGSMNGTVNY